MKDRRDGPKRFSLRHGFRDEGGWDLSESGYLPDGRKDSKLCGAGSHGLHEQGKRGAKWNDEPKHTDCPGGDVDAERAVHSDTLIDVGSATESKWMNRFGGGWTFGGA